MRPYVPRTTLTEPARTVVPRSSVLFLFFSSRACSRIYSFASRLNAVCQLRSFPSADAFSFLPSSVFCSGDSCANECSAAWCGSTLPVPPLLNLLVQSYHTHGSFFFFSVRACSHIYLFASRRNAVCQLRSFSSADDCFIFLFLASFFLFSTLQPHAQERTAPASVPGIDAAVRYPNHTY